MNETEALVVLNAVPGLGNRGIQKLLEYYGSALNVLARDEQSLSDSAILSPKAARNILDFPQDKFLKDEYNLLDARQVKVITYRDDGYPGLLREIPDAPVVLYVKGDLASYNPSVAVVGSRKASLYGLSIAQKFAVRFGELGIGVVSGLARGIDTAAHQGALRADGYTLAVLGCGLANVYPPENKALFQKIAETGAVISEFSMAASPLPYNFPRRNRIISGLSLGVIVVEAAEHSGALITADFALEQGREVFAIPGKIDQPTSSGVHRLIKQGAKLVTCVEDILEDIQLPGPARARGEDAGKLPDAGREDSSRMSPEEREVYSRLSDRPVHIDELTHYCGQTLPVTAILLQLELKRLVKQLPGKLFVR
jgi:DNA processing protein